MRLEDQIPHRRIDYPRLEITLPRSLLTENPSYEIIDEANSFCVHWQYV